MSAGPPRPRNGWRTAVPFDVYLREGVDRSGGDDACWPWKFSRDRYGYGVIWTMRAGVRRVVRVSHLALEAAGRPVPPGLFACHRCDNPPCCNPAHLFAGTQFDNMRDAVRKGRHFSPFRGRKGERSTSAKLTNSIVLEIRALSRDGLSQRALARRFDISQPHVGRLVRRENWAHLNAVRTSARPVP